MFSNRWCKLFRCALPLARMAHIPTKQSICSQTFLSDEDAEKIRDRVRQIGQRVEFHFIPGSDPYIEIFT